MQFPEHKSYNILRIGLCADSKDLKRKILKMTNFIKRWQQQTIQDALKTRRVVLLSGSRQCGKTTLARALQTKDVEYRTLDDIGLLEAAKSDPHSFVKHESKTLIIDEVRRVPDLLLAIKMAVDNDTRSGQYLLTGSANLNAIPTARESLAGRIAKLRLRPLSQAEILGAQPIFLQRLFDGELKTDTYNEEKEQIIEYAMRGGYPEAIALPEKDRRAWHRDYTTALLDRDLQDVARIHRKEAVRELLNVLAAWSSKYMDISSITSKISVKRKATESYINALEALYLAERVPAWSSRDYDRIGKHPKIFMTDCGIMATLLDWRIDQIRLDSDRIGKLFETFAFNELMAQVDYNDYRMYHYRDWEKREIDFLIERPDDGALLGIEIKASTSASKNDFKHLRWFKENLAKTRPFTGIVLYAGTNTLSFGDDFKAVPFSAIWS